MSYQVKVEYSEDKWISFFVDMSDVHALWELHVYRFGD